MKEKVLRALRDEDDYVSGQALCEKLGVSRTAVCLWIAPICPTVGACCAGSVPMPFWQATARPWWPPVLPAAVWIRSVASVWKSEKILSVCATKVPLDKCPSIWT